MCSNFAVTSLRHIFRSKNSLRGYATHMRRNSCGPFNVRYISHEPILDASTVFLIGFHTTAFKIVRSAVVELFHTYSQIHTAISIPVP